MLLMSNRGSKDARPEWFELYGDQEYVLAVRQEYGLGRLFDDVLARHALGKDARALQAPRRERHVAEHQVPALEKLVELDDEAGVAPGVRRAGLTGEVGLLLVRQDVLARLPGADDYLEPLATALERELLRIACLFLAS